MSVRLIPVNDLAAVLGIDLKVDGPAETRGGIKGTFPVNGQYNAYQYPNWACKFFIDSNMLERVVLLERHTSSTASVV